MRVNIKKLIFNTDLDLTVILKLYISLKTLIIYYKSLVLLIKT